MVIKTTRWSPDTCGCVFEYEWDDATNESTRQHIFKRVDKECVSHSHLTGNSKKDMYDSSVEENQRKNGTVSELASKASAEYFDISGDGTTTLKNGVTIYWTWSGTAPNRIMTIHVVGKTLTQNRMNQIQNALNTKFGINKVIFATT